MCNPDCKQHSYTGVSEGDVFLLALVGRICPCVQHEVQYPLLNSLVALYFSNTQSWNSSQSSLMFPPMDFLNELKRKKINKKKEKKKKRIQNQPTKSSCSISGSRRKDLWEMELLSLFSPSSQLSPCWWCCRTPVIPAQGDCWHPFLSASGDSRRDPRWALCPHPGQNLHSEAAVAW